MRDSVWIPGSECKALSPEAVGDNAHNVSAAVPDGEAHSLATSGAMAATRAAHDAMQDCDDDSEWTSVQLPDLPAHLTWRDGSD